MELPHIHAADRRLHRRPQAREASRSGTDYRVDAVESTSAVVVMIARPHAAEDVHHVGARRTTTGGLVQPLSERAVLELQGGMPVPLTITA